jgi:hypothetical protein
MIFSKNKIAYSFLLSVVSLLFIGFFTSCKEEEVEFQTNECKVQPPFIKVLGFNPNRSALSTSEKKMMGLVLVEFNQPGDTSHGGRRTYQHPSWKSAGWLGPIQLDPGGNCFVGPVPVINLLDNPPAKQNIIYKADAQSGELKMFTELPAAANISSTNPYGILGFAYLCESNILYVSTVQGSTREKENGCIYALDAGSGKIIDRITNTDAMGMGISYASGKRVLYFGSARNPDIFSVTLSKEGKFSGKPQPAFSIAGMGPRGDDKVRRIKFDKAGQMQVHGLEFQFNLTAPTEKQENIYNFVWDEATQKWMFNKN